MIPVNELATTRHGTVCVHRFDAYVGQSCLLYGEFSGDEVDFLSALVGPGSVVIDGGANVGAVTLPLAKRVGEFGLVVAIEPQRLTFQALCATVSTNHLTNVRTEHAALGKARKAFTTKAGAIAAFDFSSDGAARSRMVVGLLTTADGNSWFLKMVGDEGPVSACKPEFMRFLESLRLD